jgi:hypothetical protein
LKGWSRTASILNVEGVAKRSVERGALVGAKVANPALAEARFGHGDDVVTTDDTRFRKALIGSDLDLGSNPAKCPGDGGAGDSRENLDCGIAREYTDGTAAGRSTEVSPDDVTAGYHSGTVSAASRAADWTTSGSCGVCR